MLAAILAMAINLQSPWEAYSSVELPAPWTHIELGSWGYLTQFTGGRGIILSQPARQPDNIWIRTELKASEDGYRSVRELYEVDCTQWRWRVKQRSYFAENNLQGRAESGLPGAFQVAAPDTIAEAILNQACAH